MPLSVLIALVVGGIAGVAILTHLFGFSKLHRFDDAEAARMAFLREWPDVATGTITLSADRHSALIETDKGPALVWAMGADSSVRFLADADAQETKTGLSIRLADLTAPNIRIRLAPDERRAWLTSMKVPR
jgi:hypothetical protein